MEDTDLKSWLTGFLVAGVVLLAMDATWLTLTAEKLYRASIGDLMAESFRAGPAIAFYALYIAGLTILAVRPAVVARRWTSAIPLGAVVGLVAYGTYDLTNQATLKEWPLTLTLADMAWGCVLSAISAAVGAAAAIAISRRDAR